MSRIDKIDRAVFMSLMKIMEKGLLLMDKTYNNSVSFLKKADSSGILAILSGSAATTSLIAVGGTNPLLLGGGLVLVAGGVSISLVSVYAKNEVKKDRIKDAILVVSAVATVVLFELGLNQLSSKQQLRQQQERVKQNQSTGQIIEQKKVAAPIAASIYVSQVEKDKISFPRPTKVLYNNSINVRQNEFRRPIKM